MNTGGEIVGKANLIWIYEEEAETTLGGKWEALGDADAYLNVAYWRPDLNPKKGKIESVVAWVRLPDLPAPLFDKKFLLNLGNSLGRAIRLDVHTAQRARGKFARMCVKLDLTKPLVPEFNVEGQILGVEYESLGLICSKYGQVGHSKQGCEQFHKKGCEGSMEVEEQARNKKVAETDGEGSEGKWKIVQRGWRQRKGESAPHGNLGGSKFNILQEKTGDVVNVMREEDVQGSVAPEGIRVHPQVVKAPNLHKKREKNGNRTWQKKGTNRVGGGSLERIVQNGTRENVVKAKKRLWQASRWAGVADCNDMELEELKGAETREGRLDSLGKTLEEEYRTPDLAS
ncbi:hypothetical protein K1719_010318 [Acacia pycnantha]|nr:hypothetical protein K1719_010318 [Acacia pycnantha]